MPDPRILELHRSAPLVDLHCHPPLKLFLLEDKRLTDTHQVTDADDPFSMCVDIPSLLEGGVRVALSATHIPEAALRDDCAAIAAISVLNRRARQLFSGPPDDMTRAMLDFMERAVADAAAAGRPVAMCKSRAELDAALAANKVAFLHTIEGGHSLKGSRGVLENLEDFFQRGVCLLTLAHFYDHGISPPSPGIPHDNCLGKLGCFRHALAVDPALGLHPDGAKVVRRMLELGMVVDLTHSTPRARQDIYAIWRSMPPDLRRPLVFSHAGFHGLAPLPMNPDADELRIIQETGGVIGVIFMNYWLMGRTLKGPADSMEYVVRTIDRLCELGFKNCVALGSDFDGFTNPPRDLKEPSDFPNLTEELITRRRYPGHRYEPEEVKAFLGGNFMRVLQAGWARTGAPAAGPEAPAVTAALAADSGDVQELLLELGCAVETSVTSTESVAAPPFGPEVLEELRARLREDPTLWRDHPPHFLGAGTSQAEVEHLVDVVAAHLSQPRAALAELESLQASAEPPFELPEHCRFPGYDPPIEIQPSRRDMQEGDVKNWATTFLAAVWYRMHHRKPDLPGHADHASGFRYPLVESGGKATLALFSDWGTGYYHSEYIARHIQILNPGQAIHLGDVYYAGSPEEVDQRMVTPLASLLPQMPVWLLNGNHEMMHNGVPFFAFLERKRAQHPALQKQESTYFCLSSARYQVIAIDSDYTSNGRLAGGLAPWLEACLREGRAARKINILLSQHEPYGVGGMQKILSKDLDDLVLRDKLVDLWFWGDEHYAALHRPGLRTSFIGACIGHGGYPYGTKTLPKIAPPADVAGVEWFEAAPRFPKDVGLRKDVGNNGFCWLELEPEGITLKLVDWRRQLRYHTRLEARDGWLFLPDAPISVGSPEGDCGKPV